jgi:hypothetical protein
VIIEEIHGSEGKKEEEESGEEKRTGDARVQRNETEPVRLVVVLRKNITRQ